MKFDRFLACCGALTVMAAAASGAWAQSMPFEEARKPPLPARAAQPVLPQLAEPQLKLKGGETLFIKTVKIEGPDLGAGGEVAEIAAPYENRKLGLAAIYELADKISALYRNKGYIVAKAYVPAQDARGGVLRLKVVPGEYGQITVQNHTAIHDPLIKAAVSQAKDGPYVTRDGLERAMLLTSDLAGAGVPKIAIAPGAQPGTSDFNFDVPATPRINGYLLGDNYGMPATGRNQLSGAIDINSPFGIGDKISAYGLISEGGLLKNYRLAYAAPLGVSGAKAEISVFRTNSELDPGFVQTPGTISTAEGVSGTLSYALKRSVAESYYISGNFTHKKVTDTVLDFTLNDRNIDLGTAALTRETAGSVFGLPLTTSATLSFTEGHVDFPNPDAILNPAVGGFYSRINLSYLATLGLTDKLSFSTNIRGQKSLNKKTLDSNEQFFLTGFFGVRSFDQGFAGDSGFLVTPELKYALPGFMGYEHAISVFTDFGGAQLENPEFSAGLQKGFTELNDVGIGYGATYEYLPNRFVLLKAQLAHTFGATGPGAATYDKGTKGLLQVGFTF